MSLPCGARSSWCDRKQKSSVGDTDSSSKKTGKKKGKAGTAGKKTKKAAPRLEGDALRDELMRRERREEERVLAVNQLFYRARAYNVRAMIAYLCV